MTPIEKNIIVVDAQGNEYEATYPKRAKGLVKNGRARFVDENKICLACPPLTLKTEDINMSEQNTANETVNSTMYTVDYILSRIEAIFADTAYISQTIASLASMSDGEIHAGAPVNLQGQEKAQALGDVVRCRETTNQQMLKLYEKMYDDLMKNPNAQVEKDKWNAIAKLADVAMNNDDFASERADMLSEIRQILRENP